MPGEQQFDPSAMTRSASDAFHVNRVFGVPYEHAGRVVIPVARVMGAAGSGGGSTSSAGDDAEQTTRQDDGGGGGHAVRVKPLGVYVMDDSGVHWRPALDVNRIVLGGQIVGAVAVAVLGTTIGLGVALKRLRNLAPHLPGSHGHGHHGHGHPHGHHGHGHPLGHHHHHGQD